MKKTHRYILAAIAMICLAAKDGVSLWRLCAFVVAVLILLTSAQAAPADLPAGITLAADDIAVMDQDRMVNVEVLANDKWAPQTLPRVSIVTGPLHGTAVVRVDQSIDYTPAAGFSGSDRLTYQINDGVSVNTAVITIIVNQPYCLYVSRNGNDARSGTSWASALGTLEGARNKVRALRTQIPSPLDHKSVEVVLDDGVYATDHTIQFDATDSGTVQYPVTYRARHPLLASINGGKALRIVWQPYPAMPGVYVADLRATGLTQAALNNIHTLIVNGSRAIRAREPNVGFYTIVSADPNITHTNNLANSFVFDNTTAPGFGQPRITNAQDDILPTWKNLENVEIVFYAQWAESRMRIAYVDATNHLVRTQGALENHAWLHAYLGDYGAYKFVSNSEPTGATDGTSRYYIENCLEALNAPGEWYLDPAAQKLYYYPRAGESLSSASVVVPVVNQLIQIAGTSNLRFDGLVFRETDWTMPAAGQPGRLSGVFVPTPSAIVVDDASNVVFSNDLITQTGYWGIQLKKNATRITVVNCEFTDNGAGGVALLNVNPNVDTTFLGANRIALNRIHDNNAVWREAGGIYLGANNGYNRIAGNAIWNTTYEGMRIGWMGSKATPLNNQIVWNTISNFGTLLYDLGAINTWGAQTGTVVMGNKICDGLFTSNHLHRIGNRVGNTFTFAPGPICGIYTDEKSSGLLVKGNIIHDVNIGIFVHMAKDNIYTSNIIVDTRSKDTGVGSVLAAINVQNDAKNPDAGLVYFASNVEAWTMPLPFSVRLFDSAAGWTKVPPFAMDYDIISYGPATIESPASFGLPGLQATGHDQHALVTSEPLFVSPAAHDYRIRLSAQPLVRLQGFTADWLMESVNASER